MSWRPVLNTPNLCFCGHGIQAHANGTDCEECEQANPADTHVFSADPPIWETPQILSLQGT